MKEKIGRVPDDLVNRIVCGECSRLMAELLPDNCIDLTVTSPPYDNLRTYKGYTFDFESIAAELYRVTKPGGVVVWVVGDQTIDGSETGTSFRQVLGFMQLKFWLFDTMIYEGTKPPQRHDRYQPCFEYMFILSKDKPSTFNPIMVRKDSSRRKRKRGTPAAIRHRAEKNRTMKPANGWHISTINYRIRGNIWFFVNNEFGGDKFAPLHPASFPEALAHDHILSWSNPGDVVFDPMVGSGTTPKMAKQLGRQWLGFDIAEEYVELSRKRVANAQPPLFNLV